MQMEINSLKNTNNLNDIIYGKDDTESIVNISIKNDTVYIFREKDGEIEYATTPYTQWVLSPKYQKGYKQLKGNQFYKYIKEYSIKEYEEIKSKLYKLNLYTVHNQQEAFMIRNGFTYFKNTKINDVSILSFDIETTGTNPELDSAKVLLITNSFRKNGILIKKTFNIEDYETQYDMIIHWSMWVREIDPSLIVGHNIIIFDIPYLNTIMSKIDMQLCLGRFDEPIIIEDRIREFRKDGSQTYSYKRINIFGREIIDTFFLAIKADIARKYESYGLKSIIKHEGLEKAGRQHYDAATIGKNWHILEEREKIIRYAEDDSDDPIKLYDLMIAPFFYLTPHIPKPFQLMIESATGSQINSLMIRSYLQDDYSVARPDDIKEFEGAISFGNFGIYSNVFKVDVASLYPSIMRHYKIYPEGKDFNGNFLRILEYFTLERLNNKRLAKETGDRYYKDLEQAQKVVINSAYGFLGASGLNYNYSDGAAAVTRHGRNIITRAVDWAKDKGFTISNCDTDSISFTTGKDLTKEDRINLLKELNSLYPSAISYEDDGYYKKVIILKAKNYILYDGEKIKLKGSSLRDQKKEPALKEMLNKIIDALVFDHPDQVINIYQSYIKECLNVKDISRWAAKKTITKSILNCATDPEARLNERKVYDAIKDINVQEGDKVYLYPAILSQTIERKIFKNGNIKEKVIKETGLKRVDTWTNDHDIDKLIERVYNTAEIVSNIVDITKFIDYTLVKNKPLLKELA